MITVAVFLIIGLILVFGVFKDQIFGSGDTSSVSDPDYSAPVVDQIGDVEDGAEVTSKLYKVEDFKGKYYSEIIEDEDFEMFKFIIVDKEFSDEYPKGTVCSQSVAPGGAGAPRDTEIELVISLGSKEIKMPNVIGMTPDEAKFELLKAGFIYENIDDSSTKYVKDKDPGVVVDQVPEYGEFTQQGKTPLYFAFEDRFLGAIAVADTLKNDSLDAVRAMHKLGLNVIMLTGDNAVTAKSIADKADISQVISDVMPQDKAQVISDLRSKGHKVLMVGDGINDAPALVTADIGMAMGSGTDIAMESADIVLMGNSLLSVVNAIGLSKATIRNIKQNLFWAFFYNALGIPVAAGAFYTALGVGLSPMLGAAAMSLSSLFVVTNALRLGKFKSNITKIQETKEMETIIYVNGMMCPPCKARVESVCKGFAGVTSAEVNLEKKLVAITGDADIADIKKAITEAGYEVKE